MSPVADKKDNAGMGGGGADRKNNTGMGERHSVEISTPSALYKEDNAGMRKVHWSGGLNVSPAADRQTRRTMQHGVSGADRKDNAGMSPSVDKEDNAGMKKKGTTWRSQRRVTGYREGLDRQESGQTNGIERQGEISTPCYLMYNMEI